MTWNSQTAVSPYDIRVFACMQMRPCNYNNAFYETGNHRCDGSTGYAHCGNDTGNAKNQNNIQYQICSYCDNACKHGDKGVSCLTNRAYVGLRKCKGSKSDHHNSQIFFAVLQGKSNVSYAATVT